jgi:hypothetical protein
MVVASSRGQSGSQPASRWDDQELLAVDRGGGDRGGFGLLLAGRGLKWSQACPNVKGSPPTCSGSNGWLTLRSGLGGSLEHDTLPSRREVATPFHSACAAAVSRWHTALVCAFSRSGQHRVGHFLAKRPTKRSPEPAGCMRVVDAVEHLTEECPIQCNALRGSELIPRASGQPRRLRPCLRRHG